MKNKKDSIIVSEKEIEKELKIEKKSKKKPELEEEAEWYHYLIILGFLFLLLVFFYFGAELVKDKFFSDEIENNLSKTYPYTFMVGSTPYTIHFNLPIEEIEKLNYEIQINNFDILNTKSFKFAFEENEFEGSGYITVAAGKLLSFIKARYFFSFDDTSFNLLNQINCSNSNLADRVIVFLPNSDINGVFVEENFCVEFKSETPEKMLLVVDKLIFELMKNYEIK